MKWPHLFVVLACFALECVQAFEWEVKRFEGRDYAPLKKVAEFYNLPQQFKVENNKISLYRGERSLVVNKDSRDVMINGIKYVLSFAVLDREGTYWVSRMDLSKTIEAAFRPELVPGIKTFDTVVLDAGHGGHDKGAAGPYEYEKNFALDIARRVRDDLQQAGLKVFMTRNSDVFIALEQRAALANARQKAIFVSIHFNAAGWNRSATGFEVFSITPRGSPSTEYDELRVRDMVQEPGNATEMQSLVLAGAVNHSLQGGSLGMFDRGVKRARFAVLRLTKMPGVLIEGGFLTNAGDARKIAETKWRDEYAAAISRGILEYRKLADLRKAPRTMAQYRSPAPAPTPSPTPALPSPSPSVSSVTLQKLPETSSPSPSPSATPVAAPSASPKVTPATL